MTDAEKIAALAARVATLEEALRVLAGSLPEDGFRGDDWFGVNTYCGEEEIKRFRELIGAPD